MTAPKKKPAATSGDTGWRKASVVLVAMVCVAVLQGIDRLDAETLGTLLGLAGSYLGINLWGHRAPRKTSEE